MSVQEVKLRNFAYGSRPSSFLSRRFLVPAADGKCRGGCCDGGRGGRSRGALPAEGDRRGAQGEASGRSDSDRVRRGRRVDLRDGRYVLRAWPRVRLHRDDLRDASDQDRVSGPPRRGQRLARKVSCAAWPPNSCCWHRRPRKVRTAETYASARPQWSALVPRFRWCATRR